MAACTCDRKRRASFAEIELPWDTVSEEVMFLNKVDSLKYENGVYYLTLGQGEYGNKKADFYKYRFEERMEI